MPPYFLNLCCIGKFYFVIKYNRIQKSFKRHIHFKTIISYYIFILFFLNFRYQEKSSKTKIVYRIIYVANRSSPPPTPSFFNFLLVGSLFKKHTSLPLEADVEQKINQAFPTILRSEPWSNLSLAVIWECVELFKQPTRSFFLILHVSTGI